MRSERGHSLTHDEARQIVALCDYNRGLARHEMLFEGEPVAPELYHDAADMVGLVARRSDFPNATNYKHVPKPAKKQ